MSDVQTFEFQPEHDGSLSLESAVFQALGAASTCWESLSNTGIFDSTRAKAIGEALLEKINTQYPSVEGDFTNLGPECFTNGEVISYKGDNYYRACDELVTHRQDGESFCVKRVGHPGNIHEDYLGHTKQEGV